jgi:mRNA (guanine-N7-)-methyltransferase
VDIAGGSLKDFVERMESKGERSKNKIDKLICADSAEDLCQGTFSTFNMSEGSWRNCTGPLNTRDLFDIISCQFSMHYMFESRERAGKFFDNISKHLKPGGVYIATTVDCRTVTDAVMRAEYGPVGSAHDGSVSNWDRPTNKSVADVGNASQRRSIAITNLDGDNTMKLEFDQKNWDRVLNRENPDGEDAFGVRYNFRLDDGTSTDDIGDGLAVDAPEWLVPLGETLRNFSREYGLELILCQNFQGYVHSSLNLYR